MMQMLAAQKDVDDRGMMSSVKRKTGSPLEYIELREVRKKEIKEDESERQGKGPKF